jgi:hypothetical protein
MKNILISYKKLIKSSLIKIFFIFLSVKILFVHLRYNIRKKKKFSMKTIMNIVGTDKARGIDELSGSSWYG